MDIYRRGEDKKNADRAESRFKSFYHDVDRGKLLR